MWMRIAAHCWFIMVWKNMNFILFYLAYHDRLGVLASLCWDRALGFPLERPKSVTTD